MALKNLTTSFSRLPRWLRISTYLIIAYLVYALILGVITPLVLQSQLPKSLTETLGRQTSIDKIRINPFLLRVRVTGFAIAEQNSNDAFVRFDLLETDFGFWRTLTTLAPTIEHIYLISPYSKFERLEQGDTTRFNFSDIIDQLAANGESQSEPSDSEETSVPHVRLDRFHLEDGQIELSDNVTGAALSYPDLELDLANIDTRANISLQPEKVKDNERENRYRLDIVSHDGGKFHFDGLFQLAPLEVAGQISSTNISLPPLWPLSEDIIEAQLTGGKLDFNVQYRLAENADGIVLKAGNGSLTLSGLALSDSNTEKLTIDKIALNGLALDTAASSVDIESLAISHPMVNGVYSEDGLDLISIFTPQTAHATSPQPVQNKASSDDEEEEPATVLSTDASGTAPAWLVTLNAFSLNDGDIQLTEKQIADSVNWRVSQLAMSTGEIRSDFSKPVSYEVSFGVAGDPDNIPQDTAGTFSASGAADISNLAFDGEVKLDALSLSQLQPYIIPYVNLSLTDGAASAQGRFEANGDGKILFEGSAGVTSLNILDGLHFEPLLKWQDMQISGLRYSTDDNALTLQNIDLTAPYAKLLIDEQRRTNIGAIIKSDDKEAAQSETAQAGSGSAETADGANDDSAAPDNAPVTPLLVKISNIDIDIGSAYFADNSLTPRFASGIESLNGSVSDLYSRSGTAAKVDIEGRIDGYAPVSLKGSLNPLLEDMFLDLNFAVSGAELTSVNPYAGTYMGYYIDAGLLSLDVEYKLQNNELDGDNHVVIDQLTLGRESDSEQALSLPLGLAVALLQDSDGVIDLGLEVSGDLDNPDFSFGSIILNALGNAIKKAVTAPFSFLASLVGSDDDELNEVDFSAGSSDLDDAASQRLTTLADALRQRPGLRLSIEGTVNEVNDTRQLKISKLNDELVSTAGIQSLPENFSASEIPLEGPLAQTVEQLFTERLNSTVEAERENIVTQLQQGKDTSPDDDAVTRAMHIAMYNQLREQVTISEGDLFALAGERAKAVKVFLANEADIKASRLFLLNSSQHLKSETSSALLTLKAD